MTLDSNPTTADAKHKPLAQPPAGSDKVDHNQTPKDSPPTIKGAGLVEQDLHTVHALAGDKPKGPNESQALKSGVLEIPPLSRDGKPTKPPEQAATPGAPHPVEGAGKAPVDGAPKTGGDTAPKVSVDGAPKTPGDAAPKAADGKPPEAGSAIGNMIGSVESTIAGAASYVKDGVQNFLDSDAVKKVQANIASGNYSTQTDLLSDKNLTGAIVKTTTDANGRTVTNVDEQMGRNAIDAQALRNEFAKGSENGRVTGDMFRQIGGSLGDNVKKGGDGLPNDPKTLALDAERKKLTGDHKPGDNWTDAKTSAVYSLDKNNNLLVVQGKGEVQYYGSHGQSFQRDANGVETWRNNGAEIKSLGHDNYTYTDTKGNTTTLDKAEGKIVHEVQGLQIAQFQAIRSQLTGDAIGKLPDGLVMHSNAIAFLQHDEHGNRLVKDSLRHGESVFAPGKDGKPGQEYRIEHGHVFEVDAKGNRSEKPLADDKIPSFLQRQGQGFRFGSVDIDGQDGIHDKKHDVRLADMSHQASAEQGLIHASAQNGKEDLDVKGQFHAHSEFDPNTNTSTFSQTDGNGKPEFGYNFNSGTLQGDGITFTPHGAHVHSGGSDFAVSDSGKVESTSQWDSENAADGITDTNTGIQNDGSSVEGVSSDGSSADGTTIDSQSEDAKADQAPQDGDKTDPDDSEEKAARRAARQERRAENLASRDGKEFEEGANKEDKRADRQHDRWDELQMKREGREDHLAGQQDKLAANEDKKDIVDKWREDWRSGKLLDLPKGWKEHGIMASLDRGALMGAVGNFANGTASIGDAATVESVKESLEAAGSRYGVDVGSFTTRLAQLEDRIIDKSRVKETIEQVGGTADASSIKMVQERGGGLLAAATVVQQDERATA